VAGNVKEDAGMRYIAGLMMLAAVTAGCATSTPTGRTATMTGQPPVDITGAWSGSWEGYGVQKIKRHDVADARFTQQGAMGTGRVWMEGILASESVPLNMRLAGAAGVPVAIEVTGNRVLIRHPRDERLFAAEFAVHGDRMVGRVLTADQPGRIVLERVRPREVVATEPSAPTAPAAPIAVAAIPDGAAESVTETPPAPRPAPREFAPSEALKQIHFTFGGSDLETSETLLMDDNVQWLKANPDVLVIVEGHCDERGTAEYNLVLGERRARTVRDYLLAHGIAAERITLVSYGEERPSCTEENEACWRENRRAALVISAKE
jgi:peptidoglycan-associated lipoprotein